MRQGERNSFKVLCKEESAAMDEGQLRQLLLLPPFHRRPSPDSTWFDITGSQHKEENQEFQAVSK